MGDEDDGQQDPETGQFTPRFSDQEILEIVEDQEPVGTADVSEELGCTRQAAYYRLSRLEEKGQVQKKKIGGNLVWMVTP